VTYRKQGGLAVALLLACAAPAGAAPPITGRWLSEGGKALVELGQCGGAVCGRIVRVLVPASGATTDRNNPDPKLRTRPLAGLTILSGFTDAGSVWKGRIYDPESGRIYRSELERRDGTLRVKGCLGPFCRTQVWRPAP
jgi:uncharacterized protein (DUF2147 family)